MFIYVCACGKGEGEGEQAVQALASFRDSVRNTALRFFLPPLIYRPFLLF